MTKKMNGDFTIKKLKNTNQMPNSHTFKKNKSHVIELPRLNIQTIRTRHAVYPYRHLY